MKKKFFAVLFCCIMLCTAMCGCGKKPLEDGSYTIQVTLSGGSGRASIQSPAKITVKADSITAVICWDSSNYEYMKVDEIQYLPSEEKENSTFEIPIVLDSEMPVIACTSAMSQPYEIEYTLYFDSSTIKGEK